MWWLSTLGWRTLGMFKLFLFRRRLEKVNREPKYDLMRADQILWSALKF